MAPQPSLTAPETPRPPPPARSRTLAIGAPAWLRDSAGGLPSTYWVLWTGMLINRVGGFVVLFLSLYLTGSRGLSPALAGLVVGGHGLGAVAGTLLGGVLADRWGRRHTIVLGQLSAVGVLVALGFSNHLAAIVPLTALLGLAQAMPQPALVAAIVDVVPAADRTRAFNLQFWAMNLGLAGASVFAGLAVEAGYLLLFVVDAAATLIAALLVLWKVPETLRRAGNAQAASAAPGNVPAGSKPSDSDRDHPAAADAEPVARRREGLRTALSDRIFLVFVGLSLVLAVINAQMVTILPLAMAADGLRPSAYGLVVAFSAALIVLGQLFVPRFIAGYRKGSVLALSLLLMGAGYAVVSLAGPLWIYVVAAMVWTGGGMLGAPPNAAVIAELSPPLLRARYQAVFFLTFSVAAFIAPALGGVSLQYLGSWHWVLCGLLGLAAAGGHLLASGPREIRVARQGLDANRPVTPDLSAGRVQLSG